jgi:hypothetical protein
VSPPDVGARGPARKLLVITYCFGSNGPIGGLRWAGITKYLARSDWEVRVLTAPLPDAPDAAIGVRADQCPRFPTLGDGYRSLRRLVLGPAYRGVRAATPPAPPGRLRWLEREVAALLAFPDEGRGWVLRAAWNARRIIRRFQPEVVVSSGPPHSAHLVAALSTIGSGVRWWIDLRDPWAGPLPGIWRSHFRVGTRTFRALSPRLERLTFRLAHGVIANTDGLTAALAEKYPGLRVVRVPNGVDPECLPVPAPHRYPGLGIVYAGTLYTGRDLGPVVRALGMFLERHREAVQAGSQIRVAGEAEPGHARAFYDAVAAAAVGPYVEVLGPLPRDQALGVVSRSRLAVVLAQEQEHQIPAKLYESVGMGVPTLVIAPEDSAAAVEGRRVGALVRDGADVEGIACVLERLWRNGSSERPTCSVPITYDAIAPLVDRLLRDTVPPDARPS